MSDHDVQPETARKDQPGWDAMAEDIFGLSLRGLKTMRDLFVRPATVFAAAREENWNDQYTPSIRLIFSLLAATMLLSYFWAGESSANYQMVLETYQDVAERFDNTPTAEEMTDQFFAYWSLIFPFAYVVFHLLGAVLLRVWGRGTEFVVRARLYFACVTPALILSLFSLLLMPLIPVEQITEYALAGMGVGAVVYFITFYRGMANVCSAWGRIWRGSVFALTVFAFDFSANFTTGMAATRLYRWLAPTGFVLDT